MLFSPSSIPKICHTYPTIIKCGTVVPYLKKTQVINKSRDKLLEFADISNFSSKISKFCYIRKYRYRLHFGTSFLILLNLLFVFEDFLINMVTILMMSAKLAQFCQHNFVSTILMMSAKGYDVMTPDYDVTNKILSRDSNYIVDAVM